MRKILNGRFSLVNEQEKGITLVALVITIVVIIILAVVTINFAFGEGGIVQQAQSAAEYYANDTKYTEEAVANVISYLNKIVDNVLEIPEKWDTTKILPVLSDDNQYVPVPHGYIASEVSGERTIENGFVIYEGNSIVNDSNVQEEQKNRNQFVWIPVKNVKEIYGTDNNGKKWGKNYNFSELEIQRLNWEEKNGVMTITNFEQFYEPDTLTEDSLNSITVEQLEREFNNMISSIETYGGFFIGRYETGNLSEEEAAIVKNNNDIANQQWITMYQKSKTIAANSNVTSTMIWGCQWDAVMNWLYNSGDNEKKKYTYDSTGKGNYEGEQGSNYKIIPTGSDENYKINNIYDMAGNVGEWTMEILKNEYAEYRVVRGYYLYNATGIIAPAGSRNYEPISSSQTVIGTRAALFINTK